MQFIDHTKYETVEIFQGHSSISLPTLLQEDSASSSSVELDVTEEPSFNFFFLWGGPDQDIC
jgi:hypothetical protein